MKSSKKEMKKRLLALLLCITMVLNGGISAVASDVTTSEGTTETNNNAEIQPALLDGVHVHTGECYAKSKVSEDPICGKEVTEGHIHGDDCYGTTSDPELTCTLEETEGHSHGESCFEKTLSCGSENHTHDDNCYKTENKLICGQEESEEHIHGAGCYEECTERICGTEEHSHVDGCYQSNKICELEEVAAHIHSEGCYTTGEKPLTCELTEVEAHAHSDECYEWTEELVCGIEAEEPVSEEPAEEAVEVEDTVETEEPVEEEELVTITEYEDDQVIIKVQAVDEEAEGIIPEGAKLQVTPITQENEKYEEVEEQIQDTVKDENYGITGFLAYDITFVDGEGNEVKPNGEILVSMSYKEAIVPETVDKEADSETDVTVLHFEEDENGEVAQIVDMSESEQLTSIQTTKDNEVEAAEFKTESFSIFTIVWKQEAIITAHCVDANGKSIGEESVEIRKIDIDSGEGVAIKDLALNIIKVGGTSQDDYEYVRAYLKKDTETLPIEGICYSKDYRWQYKKGEEWKDIENGYELYLEYSIKSELKVNRLPVVDTKGNGINISLFNYKNNRVNKNGFNFVKSGSGNAKYTWFKDNKQHVHQNYVCYNLYNGFPVLNASYDEVSAEETTNKEFANAQSTSQGESLDYLFSAGKNASVEAYTDLSGLLQRNSDGYYYYDSHYNHAQYNRETNSIDVYDARLAHGNRAIEENRGAQFLPFNNINSYTSTEPVMREGFGYIYTMPESDVDLWFGMKIDASFYQPRNGQLDGKDMVFEFSGDDDVWMFIDGVKVLDIGGIHSQTTGSVNFHTGDVYVYDNTSSGSLKGKPYHYTYKTTLLECFKNAYIEKNDNCTDAELDAYLSQYFDKDEKGEFLPRFRNYTSHMMNFFYLERGWGSSNCKIQFNMPPLSEKSVTVEKEIANFEPEKFNDVEFSFKLYTKEDDEDKKPVVAAKRSYTLKTASGGLEERKTDGEGVFKLKHNEQAVFLGIMEGTKYYVEEIGVNSDEYDKVTINGVEQKTDTGENQSNGTFTSKELIVGQINKITFVNKCDINNLRHLIVKKVLSNDVTPSDDYKVKVTLGGQPYTGYYDLITYNADGTTIATTVSNQRPVQDGIITLKHNQAAEILGYVTEKDEAGNVIKTGIPSGTSFKVEELTTEAVNEDRYYAPIYTILNADYDSQKDIKEGFSGEGHASGKIQLTKDAEVTVTNEMKPIIEVTKVWDPTDTVADKPEVYVGLYSNTEVVKDGEGNDKYLVLKKDNEYKAEFLNLEKGKDYSVKELRPVIGEETAQFTINGTGYVGVAENEIVTLNDITYRVTYLPKTGIQIPNKVLNSNELKHSVTITNTQLGSLKIIKVSSSDKSLKLEGAEFKIEKLNSQTGKYEKLTSGKVYDSSEGQYKEITLESDTVYVTDGSGKIYLKELEAGTYQITETKAPTGYSLLAEPITIEIGVEGVYVIEKEIPNTPLFELPSTGGHGTYWYTLGGFALMMSTVLSWYKNKRKEVLGE